MTAQHDDLERDAIRAADGLPPATPWERGLRVTSEGRLTRDVGNAALILAHSPEWAGVFVHDSDADRILVTRAPLVSVPGLSFVPGELRDTHYVFTSHWLARFRGVSFGRETIADGIRAAAAERPVRPCRDYLASLAWDGTARLEHWLATYLGCEDTEYVRAVGRMWLISLVARTFRPGEQADYMLILEGPQGAAKSSALRTIGGPWYLGSLPSLRDAVRAAASLRGKTLIEIGELDALRGAESTRVKDFISQPVDRYRPAYGRCEITVPRTCVFAGTTNDATYLRDSTGGRRFWPVRCGTIDRAALARDRDQILAEAVAFYRAGALWYPDAVSPELREEIAAQQGERFECDPWEALLDPWVARQVEVTVLDCLSTCLGLEPRDHTPIAAARVAAVLRRLGWAQGRPRRSGGRHRVWAPPGQ